MNTTQKTTTLKIISIVPFVLASIPIAFVYFFLRDLPLLSSSFVEYVHAGNSIFFPFLSSHTIIFQFTTGHLIDIILVVNFVTLLERIGYYYYQKVCLKRNFLELSSETGFIEFNKIQEELQLNSDFLLNLKGDPNPILNEELLNLKDEKKSRIYANDLFYKKGDYVSITSLKHTFFNSFRRMRKRITHHYKYSSIFLNSSTYCFSTNYSPPFIRNCAFSNPYTNIQKEEG
ncbi:MAG: hypothetical protein EAX91_00610 [Candidatus Lokiarchaeota archaeon]|nr:hypothetical protein [Candidatus Lokiarchaeota archaeon]